MTHTHTYIQNSFFKIDFCMLYDTTIEEEIIMFGPKLGKLKKE
jgi:hypothetical protein